jgi:hypothetical protein
MIWWVVGIALVVCIWLPVLVGKFIKWGSE